MSTETTVKPAAKKRLIRANSYFELGVWYLGGMVVCAALAFVMNYLTPDTISPLVAAGFGLLLVLVIHYVELIQNYGI